MSENKRIEGRHASPSHIAGEVASDCFDPQAADPEQAHDVARWRRAERARLRDERQALSVEARSAAGDALAHHLRDLLTTHFRNLENCVFSGYWPIKGEPDLRALMADLHASGVKIALPVVEVKHAPLIFRRWTPEKRMERGDWNLPVTPREAEVVMPDVTLAPHVG